MRKYFFVLLFYLSKIIKLCMSNEKTNINPTPPSISVPFLSKSNYKNKPEEANVINIVNNKYDEDKENNEEYKEEYDNFVYQNMLTCIGNKRKLVKNIRNIAEEVKIKLHKDKLNIFDGFSGSSVVSRELSFVSNNLYINDLEEYSYLMAMCFLKTPPKEQRLKIYQHIKKMNEISLKGPYKEGIICELYSPKDTNNIKEGERCFYTRENALIIDTLRNYISEHVEKELFPYCIVPLLNKASIHTNTSGVFKGFYKKDNIGCFGGSEKNSINRITKKIYLDYPIWNTYNDFNSFCFKENINHLMDKLPNDFDLIYLDPPYNQHPYGSNYFMLNVIITNKVPDNISKISGIPIDWNKSDYNYKNTARKSIEDLIEKCSSKTSYILLSYNNEGIIKQSEWKDILKKYPFTKYEINYDCFKGSRNLRERNKKVVEIMYLIKIK